MGISERGAILDREVAVGDLEVQAAELAEREPLQGAESFDPRHVRGEIEPHVGRGPAAERAAENGNAAAAEADAAEVPDDFCAPVQLGDDDLAVGERGDELEPVTSLREQAIAESVQRVPVDVVERRSVHFEQRNGPRILGTHPGANGSTTLTATHARSVRPGSAAATLK